MSLAELGTEILQIDGAGGGAFDRDRLKAGHRGTGRIGAVGTVGHEHFGAFFAAITEVSGGDQQSGQFTVRTGGGLQRDSVETADFGEDLLHLVQQLQNALQRLLGLIGMQIGDARQGGHAFVPLRVVLHRTRAERIEMRIDRHVLRREIHIVPDDFRLAELGQRGGRSGEHGRRQELVDRRLRNVVAGNMRRATAGPREFE